MGVISALFSSRKFVIAVIVIVAIAPLVYLGKLDIAAFVQTVEGLTIALIAAIGAEGVAEKWNAPPPSPVRQADSIRPPPKAPSIPPVALGMLTVITLVIACAISGCRDPNTPHNIADVALDVEQAACVILQAELGQNEPGAIATICSIPADELQQVINLVTARRKAMAKMAAMRPDGSCR